MAIRFPKVCFRCGQTGHTSDECTKMPDGLGSSPYERAMMAAVRRDRNAILWAAASIVFALLVTGWLS